MAPPGVRRSRFRLFGRQTGPQAPLSPEAPDSQPDIGLRDPDIVPPAPSDPVASDDEGRPQAVRRIRSGIAMWGPPGSGKTTFLAALERGLTAWAGEQERPGRGWWLRGTTRDSADTLSKLTGDLIGKGKFPAATDALPGYDWELVRQVPARWWRRLLRLPWSRGRRWSQVTVPLGLADAAGVYFDPDSAQYKEGVEELVTKLASSAGIIFVFDPIREANDDDAYQHTFSVINRLAQECPPVNGKLPHYVAVCVAKFDDPRVYRAAVAAEKVMFNAARRELPYVPEENAEDFFIMACQAARQLDRGLPETLRLRFNEDRIRYFATSAVGFYVDPRTGRFNPDDSGNVEEWQEGHFRVRGQMSPINIVEPVTWLAEQLRKAPKKEAGA